MKTFVIVVLTFFGTLLLVFGALGGTFLLFSSDPEVAIFAFCAAVLGVVFLGLSGIMKEQMIIHEKIELIMAALDVKQEESIIETSESQTDDKIN